MVNRDPKGLSPHFFTFYDHKIMKDFLTCKYNNLTNGTTVYQDLKTTLFLSKSREGHNENLRVLRSSPLTYIIIAMMSLSSRCHMDKKQDQQHLESLKNSGGRRFWLEISLSWPKITWYSVVSRFTHKKKCLRRNKNGSLSDSGFSWVTT